MADSSEDLLSPSYYREQLLPIWERWTDGSPAMRRLLECADPLSAIERRAALCNVRSQLMTRRDTASVAAVEAALALLLAVARMPSPMVRKACAEAQAASEQAEAELRAALGHQGYRSC